VAEAVWQSRIVGPELLSAREREVLGLLARGHTNREVAARLHISVRTAEWHRASIRRKLSIASRAELVDFAAAHDLV
jgi:two-component system response regulator NreC